MRQIAILMPEPRHEAAWFISSFILAQLLNIYAIAAFKTPWRELVTSLPWVLALALLFYVLSALVRLFVALIRRRLIRSSKQSNTGKTQ